MLSKVKLMAATLAMMAFAAVPAVAQNTVDASDTDIEADDNNVSIAQGGDASADGGDGGDGGDQNGDINQDVSQYDQDQVSAGDVNSNNTGGTAIDTGAEQNVGDNTQYAGDGGDGGDGGIAIGGDADSGDIEESSFFSSFWDFFDSFFD